MHGNHSLLLLLLLECHRARQVIALSFSSIELLPLSERLKPASEKYVLRRRIAAINWVITVHQSVLLFMLINTAAVLLRWHSSYNTARQQHFVYIKCSGFFTLEIFIYYSV